MSAEPFDFLKPGPLASGPSQQLNAWLQRACALANRQWAKTLPFPLEISLGTVDRALAGSALASLPESSVGYPLVLGDAITTLLAWPRDLALALVMSLLGETQNQLP